MSDDGRTPNAGADDDLSLPKATVNKVIADLLPPDVACSKETKDLILECCVEFIHLVSSQANEICDKEARKTIAPEHIVSALKQLGFENYVEEVESVLKDHKQSLKDREKKTSKFDSGLTQEELQQQQEALFAQAKARFEAGSSGVGLAGPSNTEPSSS